MSEQKMNTHTLPVLDSIGPVSLFFFCYNRRQASYGPRPQIRQNRPRAWLLPPGRRWGHEEVADEGQSLHDGDKAIAALRSYDPAVFQRVDGEVDDVYENDVRDRGEHLAGALGGTPDRVVLADNDENGRHVHQSSPDVELPPLRHSHDWQMI